MEHGNGSDEMILVPRAELLAWAKAWQDEYGPNDGADCVTPFDAYLLKPPVNAQSTVHVEVLRHMKGTVKAIMPSEVAALDAAIAALSAPQPPVEAHCATCSCVPGMTPAVRFDATPAEKEGAVRDHLIRMGWTPPAEAQPVYEGVDLEGGWIRATAPPSTSVEDNRWKALIGQWQRRVEDAGYNGVEDALDAAVASLSAQQSGDWVLVPRDATPEMWEAGMNCHSPDDTQGDYLEKAWAAMLAAAPQPPAEAQAQGGGEAELRRMVARLAAHVRPTCGELWAEAERLLNRTAPPSAPVGAGEVDCRCVDCGGNQPGHDPTCSYMHELHGEAQPVAWDVFDKEGTLIAGRVSKADADEIASRWEYEGSHISPLYAHPPPSAPVGVESEVLRRAADELRRADALARKCGKINRRKVIGRAADNNLSVILSALDSLSAPKPEPAEAQPVAKPRRVGDPDFWQDDWMSVPDLDTRLGELAENYEWGGDETVTITERERMMLIDFAHGIMADEIFVAMLKAHHDPSARGRPGTPPPSAPVGVEDESVRVGNLPTMNQDGYPGLGEWWVQLWRGDEIIARVYGDGPDEVRSQAQDIADALNQQPAADNRICSVCDGGPGNDGPCLCGERRWEQPAAVDGDNPYPAPRNRQEAAALAKLALAYLGVTSAHIDAVVARCETDLAAQHGGGAS